MENETRTASDLNAATDASVAARTAAIASAPKTAPKAAPKAATKPRKAAPAPAPAPAPARKALTPRERAARPVTANIATYVEWLAREVYGRKLTGPEVKAAGVAITLYGAYQKSATRREARGY